ncbi:MAG: DUF427 domain-containing protein [Aeromicrobium sp.]|nr:DUF427 domain-containing protein [Burkholderiales bacterium]
MATATWQGKVIAEVAASDVVVVEGNIYFPISSVHAQHLQASSHQTACPWKGTAHYYDVVVDGAVNKNAAWYYPEPKDAAKQIMGRVAFWKGVEVVA